LLFREDAITPILRDRVDHPMAWRGCDLFKEEISFDLSPRHAAALEDVLLKVRKAGLLLGEIRAEHCRHPALDDYLERAFDEIQEGRGIVLVRGFPVAAMRSRTSARCPGRLERISVAAFRRSALGDLLGQVSDETPCCGPHPGS
jgi:hypothetical protein